MCVVWLLGRALISSLSFFVVTAAWLRLGALDDCNIVTRQEDDSFHDESAQERQVGPHFR